MQSAQTSVHSAAQGPAVKTMSPDASAISIRAEWQSLCMNTWQSHYERLFLTSTQWGFWWLQSFCEVVSCAWKMIQHILRLCALHTLFTPCHVIYTAVHLKLLKISQVLKAFFYIKIRQHDRHLGIDCWEERMCCDPVHHSLIPPAKLAAMPPVDLSRVIMHNLMHNLVHKEEHNMLANRTMRLWDVPS